LYGFKTYKPFPLVIFASSRVSQSCVFWFDWVETMFVGMNVVMGRRTTAKTPTTWGQSNVVV
jgi:hypothetical protein